MKLDVSENVDELARRAADWMLGAARATEGAFAVALSGGETPRRLYALLATPPYREAFPFARAHWFWGDERFVPPDDVKSNYRMAREVLLARIPVPPENVHPVRTVNVSPEESASLYEHELRRFYGSEQLDPMRPLFQIDLLGLGEDGHTASLFPGNPSLRERQKWVVTVTDATYGKRITLTYPALESARGVAFLVSGSAKRAVLHRLIEGDESIPAALVRPQGEVYVFADRGAMVAS
jgi:6-phosphogluconolactonase